MIPLPTGWNLRVVTPATAAADSLAVAAHIASIYTEFGLEFDLQFEDDLIDLDASYSTGRFWIIEGAGRIQATAAILPHGGARIFKRLYIAPTARRGGIARALFRLACAWGDFPRTELWSDVRFRNAHQLYLSEGFLQGPTRVLDDPDRSVERSFWSPPLARPRLVLA